MAAPRNVSASIADYLSSFGGLAHPRTAPGRPVVVETEEAEQPPQMPRRRITREPAIPSDTAAWEDYEGRHGGVDSSRSRYDKPTVIRRYNPMDDPARPLPVVSSRAGTMQLSDRVEAPVGWVRSLRYTVNPGWWRPYFTRFWFGPNDVRSAPVVGRRTRVPSRGQRPAPRWPVALRYQRAMSRSVLIPNPRRLPGG